MDVSPGLPHQFQRPPRPGPVTHPTGEPLTERPRRRSRFLSSGRAPTALLVRAPAARALLLAANGRDVEAASGLPPHVTIVYPFVDARRVDADLITALADVMLTCAEFPYRLAHVRRFPGQVVYLAPEPAAPFIALTEKILERWPTYLPYEGAYDEIVPHLTVVQGTEPPDLQRRVAPFLPLETTATEVALLRLGADGRWATMARFPFGPPAVN